MCKKKGNTPNQKNIFLIEIGWLDMMKHKFYERRLNLCIIQPMISFLPTSMKYQNARLMDWSVSFEVDIQTIPTVLLLNFFIQPFHETATIATGSIDCRIGAQDLSLLYFAEFTQFYVICLVDTPPRLNQFQARDYQTDADFRLWGARRTSSCRLLRSLSKKTPRVVHILVPYRHQRHNLAVASTLNLGSINACSTSMSSQRRSLRNTKDRTSPS